MDILKKAKTQTTKDKPIRVYRSEELLKAQNKAEILHRGERYVLRKTRAGKLILNK
tara:strand:+ start:313 stop:480 length:168 start_codon:yes stop_codon:yes gene_type:complete